MTTSIDDSGVFLHEKGRVFLVGAGPGDPELLTVRAFKLLTSAPCIAYDELVSREILALGPKDAEYIPVGRRKGTSPDAPPIDPRILERARDGIDVLRLKGGDPFVFGRGGEEAEQLAALGIPFEVVPGISAALGAAAATGIPLTHRDASPSVAFVTAHLKHDAAASLPGDALADRVPRTGTVVLYMSLGTLRETAARLVEGGRAPSTPVAVVAHATLPTQRLVVADLESIADAVERAALPAPALVIVGGVVDKRVPPARSATPVTRPASAAPARRAATGGVRRE